MYICKWYHGTVQRPVNEMVKRIIRFGIFVQQFGHRSPFSVLHHHVVYILMEWDAVEEYNIWVVGSPKLFILPLHLGLRHFRIDLFNGPILVATFCMVHHTESALADHLEGEIMENLYKYCGKNWNTITHFANFKIFKINWGSHFFFHYSL